MLLKNNLITELKEQLQEQDYEEEYYEIPKIENDIQLARYFLVCYDRLLKVKFLLEPKTWDKIFTNIQNLKERKLRDLMLDYQDGDMVGDNYIFKRISNIINNNRENYLQFIEFVNKVTTE